MARKLFAMEENKDTEEFDPLDKRNQLLIDKVLEYDKKTQPNTSVTADLIKQRHDLRKEITEQLNAQKQEEEEEGENDNQEPDNSTDNPPQDDSSANTGDNDNSAEPQDGQDNKDNKNTTEPKDDKPKADGDESDESAAADDIDSLRGLVGDKGNKTGNNSDDKDDDKKTAAESLRATKRTPDPKAILSSLGHVTALKQIFDPLKRTHQKRMLSIESFGLKASPKVTDQPLVYVKDDVLESLNRLITLSNHYITKNNSSVAQGAEGLKAIGEQLTAYSQFIEAGKFHFSQKLVQDEELLKPLSVPGKNDLDYTSSLLSKYLEDSSALAVKLMQNPFEQIADALASGGYKDEQGAMINELTLPGFAQMQASVVPFSNYIDTKYENYQIYKVHTFKPQDLYSLPALSLDKDKDLKKLLSELDKILISTGLILDNIKDMSAHYQTFIDGLKTISFDVEKGTQTNLAGLGLDAKLKDFIKFKLVTELYINDVDSAVQYISAALRALSLLVQLSDK